MTLPWWSQVPTRSVTTEHARLHQPARQQELLGGPGRSASVRCRRCTCRPCAPYFSRTFAGSLLRSNASRAFGEVIISSACAVKASTAAVSPQASTSRRRLSKRLHQPRRSSSRPGVMLVEQAEVVHRLAAVEERPVALADVLRVLDLGMVARTLEADVRRDEAVSPALEPADDRAERRPLRGFGEAGVDLLELVLHRLDELHGADQGQLVGDLRLQRHQLADVEARHVGLDRLEVAAALDAARRASGRTCRCGSARPRGRP